jgi:antitoxin YefM
MRVSSYSQFRRNFASALDSLAEDNEPLIFIRDRDKPAAVLFSPQAFASFEETQFRLKSPRNAERLLESIAELNAGKGDAKTLIE